MMSVAEVLIDAESPDPAAGLRSVTVLRRLADELEASLVDKARLAGWSWQEIGDALGVTRQAVHKKHGARHV